MVAATAIKVPTGTSLRRFGSIAPSGRGVVIGPLHPAYGQGRSLFPSRVFTPGETGRVLKSGHHSRKIGKVVSKGPRRGWPIYTLTLEERATCPASCAAWGYCYGNNMQAAERFEAGAVLEAMLWDELAALQRRHTSGFLIRLHVLGDFYSVDYVSLWGAALRTFPALHVFGFTARMPGTAIGDAVADLARDWRRFAVRHSGGHRRTGAAQMADVAHADAIPCPAQSGATDCCATCALCWHSDRSISFARH